MLCILSPQELSCSKSAQHSLASVLALQENDTNDVLCRNLSTSKEQEAHPLDVYFAELIRYVFKQLFKVACFSLFAIFDETGNATFIQMLARASICKLSFFC